MAFWSGLVRPQQRTFRLMQSQLPELNFVTLHYICFIAVWLLSSIIFWGAATPARSVSLTDAIYMGVSAMSGAGMSVMNVSSLNTFQQIVLWVDMLIGSPIVASAIVVLIRRRAFETTFAREAEKGNRLGPRFTEDASIASPDVQICGGL